jgi:hypothetical protein
MMLLLTCFQAVDAIWLMWWLLLGFHTVRNWECIRGACVATLVALFEETGLCV